MTRQRKRHFTLIELMVVLLIIGLIMALVGPNFIKKAEKAKHQAAEIQLKTLSTVIKDYYLDMDTYPEQLDDLVRDPGSDKWDGPYLEEPAEIPDDPWGEPYQYQYPGQHGTFDLWSYGADKSPGGEGNDADISNWE